jgi:uracil-DNA glycosylase
VAAARTSIGGYDEGDAHHRHRPDVRRLAGGRPGEAELSAVEPAVLACLGATAARTVLGPDFRLMQQRERFLPTRWTPKTIATVHPSAVLRGQDEADRARL